MSDVVAGSRFRPSPVGGVLAAGSDQGSAQARAAGWAAGWAAGTRAATEAAATHRRMLDDARVADTQAMAVQVDAAVNVLRRAADAVSGRIIPVLAEAAAALDDGAMTLAIAVLGRELADADGEDRARAALTRALSVPLEVGVHTVRLNPADLFVLTQIGVTAELRGGVELVGDPSLRPGDAMSEFPDGFLDARIETAVDRVRFELEGPR